MAISKIILNGVTQIDLTQDTTDASKTLASYTGHGADGEAFTGTYVPTTPTLQTKSVTYTPDTSMHSQSILADSGYDGLQKVNVTVNAVPGGTAGTPIATKGTVSNHSVSVTPSVTNTTGYITGSTKTGTAVTVSASELVSGSVTKTENGTYDVTNLAELVVNVSGGGGGSSKNVQFIQQSNTRISVTTLSQASGKITVSKTGTYDVYWTSYRTSTSGSWGTQLYINGSSYGALISTFTNSYFQSPHLTNVSLTLGDQISVYGKSRGSNYYLYVGMLLIIEQ